MNLIEAGDVGACDGLDCDWFAVDCDGYGTCTAYTGGED